MWRSIVLTVATMALKLMAPKAAGVVGKIQTVAEIALPIVEQLSKSAGNNDEKFDKAVARTLDAIALDPFVEPGSLSKENIVESGVQFAYSIFKAR